MSPLSKYVVWCDLDGVLADFDSFYHYKFRVWPKECKSDQELWARINRYRAEQMAPWFSQLPWCDGAINLVEFLDKKFPWAILSATGLNRTLGEEEKSDWVDNHIGFRTTFFVQSGRDKAKFASPDFILIDDRSVAIDPWVKAGGIGILHTSAEETIEKLKNILEKEHRNETVSGSV